MPHCLNITGIILRINRLAWSIDSFNRINEPCPTVQSIVRSIISQFAQILAWCPLTLQLSDFILLSLSVHVSIRSLKLL